VNTAYRLGRHQAAYLGAFNRDDIDYGLAEFAGDEEVWDAARPMRLVALSFRPG
jgi:hypothetical protein